MADSGIQTTCVMKTDRKVAKGMTNRRGRGKAQHLQTCELWRQEVAKNKWVDIQKVGTKDNPADLVNKHIESKAAAEGLEGLGARTATGWRGLAPRLKMNLHQGREDEEMPAAMT